MVTPMMSRRTGTRPRSRKILDHQKIPPVRKVLSHRRPQGGKAPSRRERAHLLRKLRRRRGNLRRHRLLAYDGVVGAKSFHPDPSDPSVCHVKRPSIPNPREVPQGTSSIRPTAQSRKGESARSHRNDGFKRYYYNSTSGSVAIDHQTNHYIRRLLKPGEVRTGYGSLTVFRSQSTLAKRLDREAWPSVAGKPAWPSSPSINEWLEMIRRGAVSSSDQWRHSGKTERVSLREFNSNIGIAERIVVRQVIGLRADVEMPRKFLRYFRYRWGFLILISSKIPCGLTRFLASTWCVNPYSLWLERKVSLKTFLRQVPFSLLQRARDKCSPPRPSLDGVLSSPFTEDADETSDYESVGSSELD